MTDISARDASRGFAALLDRVERDHEEYTVIRDGRQVARIIPTTSSTVGDFLASRSSREPLDEDFAADATAVRNLITDDEVNPWRD